MTDSDTFENFTDSILRMGIASTPIRYGIHVFQIGTTDVKVPKKPLWLCESRGIIFLKPTYVGKI